MSALAAKGAPVTVRESLFWPTTGTATVDVVDVDGAAVASDVSAAYDSDAAEWTVPLTHAHTASPGELTLTWTHSTGATAVTTVDVRSGNPFPLSTLTGILAGGSGTYTATEKQRALESALRSLEDACGVALVTKRSAVTLTGAGTAFRLEQPLAQALVAVPDAFSLSDCTVTQEGRVTFPSVVTDPQIIVDHGYRELDHEAERAVALLASSRLADGPFDDRGYAATGDGGFVRLMTQGMGATRFSIPEVQEFYRRRRFLVIR